jgi:hypothetical protein
MPYQGSRSSRYDVCCKALGRDVIRRDFLGALRCVALASPLAKPVQAQDAGRKYRIAALVPQPRNSPSYLALFGEMRKFGFIEGQNLTIDSGPMGSKLNCLPNTQTNVRNSCRYNPRRWRSGNSCWSLIQLALGLLKAWRNRAATPPAS